VVKTRKLNYTEKKYFLFMDDYEYSYFISNVFYTIFFVLLHKK